MFFLLIIALFGNGERPFGMFVFARGFVFRSNQSASLRQFQFPDVDVRKAESIMDTFETAKQEDAKNKLMGVIGWSFLSRNSQGLRRLLQSRWGHVMKPGHEGVFMDMDQPLCNYFCNSSHNTYLTGLQMKGEATVEGYISALKRVCFSQLPGIFRESASWSWICSTGSTASR